MRLLIITLLLALPLGAQVLTSFEKPFLFSYLSFKDHVGHQDGAVTINSKDGKGGAGVVLSFDGSPFADHSPALTLKLLPGNKATSLTLKLIDAEKKEAEFRYDLSKTKSDSFTTLRPTDVPALARDGFDHSKINSLQVLGNWQAQIVHLAIDEIAFLAPGADEKAARTAAKAKAEREAAQKREQEARKKKALEALLAKGSDHPADGPRVVHIGAAASDLLGLEIIAGEVKPTKPQPYVPQEGDVLKPDKHQVLAWNDGKPAIVPAGHELHRNVDGRLRKIGTVNFEAKTVWMENVEGLPLQLDAVDDPRAYRVRINDGEPFHPVAVYRKSKPLKVAQISGEFGGQHFIYLKLPQPLAEGSKYTVDFHALNTSEASVEFTLNSKKQRSESIHVSRLGFRMDDPFKRAYLSLWTGTGGATTLPYSSFSLIDVNGDIKFTGEIKLAIPADQSEPFSRSRNHSGTNVYHLDFHDFTRSGLFYIHIAGLGKSHIFPILSTGWEKAFKTSMHGLLCHRSGIELGPPFTKYVRPRPMHPDDGVKVFRTDINFWDGEADAVHKSLLRLMGPDLDVAKLEEVPNAWGGYMDAGDWDRRSQHLVVSYRHLELLELFPEKVGAIKLALPENEANNDLPDIVDEALWNLDFYRRLQDKDGGISSGVESTAHPRPAEASWQETLLIGAYKSDPESSYRFAACAARLARLIKDHPLAKENLTAAIKAWDWADKNAEAELKAAKDRKAKGYKKALKDTAEMRVLSAIELFRTTGEDRFLQASIAVEKKQFNNPDIAMAYALLPRDIEGPLAPLRATAKKTLVETANAVLKFSEQNGFNLAPGTRYLPMMGYTAIWSTPGSSMAPILPRAHYLTGDERYLAGTLASTQYPGDANPMNMCYTTGFGIRSPQAPLHIDSWQSGQEAPAGITVQGQSDPSAGYAFEEFAHTWFLNRFGGVHSKKWPTAEAYIDLGNWPAMNEYTVHQNISPTSYTWGYLAARP